MTLDEIKLYTLQERIKAYVYFGVDAEMDYIANKVEQEALDPDHEKNIHDIEWHKKQENIFQAKIERANKRIEDLQVLVGVEHEDHLRG